MPAILERLVSQLKAKGKPEASAYAIATSSLQRAGDLKPGSQEPTKKGMIRGKMSPGARAKDREARYQGKSPGDFKYDPATNRATQK
jgi:hypothetical protein